MVDSYGGYVVYHRSTGKTHGPYQTRSRAKNVSDKLDNAYGSYITSVRPVSGPLSGKPAVTSSQNSNMSDPSLGGVDGPEPPYKKRGGRVNEIEVSGKKPKERLDRKKRK